MEGEKSPLPTPCCLKWCKYKEKPRFSTTTYRQNCVFFLRVALIQSLPAKEMMCDLIQYACDTNASPDMLNRQICVFGWQFRQFRFDVLYSNFFLSFSLSKLNPAVMNNFVVVIKPKFQIAPQLN